MVCDDTGFSTSLRKDLITQRDRTVRMNPRAYPPGERSDDLVSIHSRWVGSSKRKDSDIYVRYVSMCMYVCRERENREMRCLQSDGIPLPVGYGGIYIRILAGKVETCLYPVPLSSSFTCWLMAEAFLGRTVDVLAGRQLRGHMGHFPYTSSIIIQK